MKIAIGQADTNNDQKGGIRRTDLLIVIAMTSASRFLFYSSGLTFDASTPFSFMQFIDPQLLMRQLLQSLWHYHANPPLLNLTTGIALKLFGANAPLALSMAFHALGFLLAASVFAVLQTCTRSRIVAYALTALMVFSPSFVLYENWLMYTFPSAALLGVSVYLLMRYVVSGATRWGVSFFVCLALLALTRSMFHLAWMIVITGTLSFSMPHRARHVLRCAAVPLILVVGWYGKNYLLFGTFSSSTWMGLGLSNITTLTVPRSKLEPLVKEGTLSEFALVSRYEDTRLLFSDLNPSQDEIPVLHNLKKSTGQFNYNYLGIVDVSALYARDGFQTALHFPAEYLNGVKLSNRLFFSPTSMNAYFTAENRIAAAPMQLVYNLLFYGAKASPVQTEVPHFGYSGKNFVEVNTGIILIFIYPLILLYALARIVYVVSGKAPISLVEKALLTYLVFNISYIYFLGTLLELAENYRYRFLTEPLFLMLVGLLIGDLNRLRRRWREMRLR